MRSNTTRFVFLIVVWAVTGASLSPLSAQESVTFQLNPARTGATEFSRGFATPLRQIWSRTFPFKVSYPVIAEGKVFVTIGDSHRGLPYGTTLYALDLRTGQTLWSTRLADTYFWSAATYQSGRLFVINADGLLRAFDPGSGSELWRRKLGSANFGEIPNVGHGMVYVTGYESGSWIYAVNQATGKLVWKQQIVSGPSPVVSKNSVLLGNECTRRSLNPLSGATNWQFYDPANFCSTPEPAAPFYGNRLYVRRTVDDGGFDFHVDVDVFDGNTGKKAVTLPLNAIYPPVINNDTAYLTAYDVVRARSVTTKQLLWKFHLPASPAMTPIVVNGKVVLLLWTGELLVLDGTTGQQLHHLVLRNQISFPSSGVTPGFGAGQNTLLVPAGDQLFALKSALQ